MWFRSVRADVKDGDSLVIALRRDFLPSDNYECLWHEIRSRTQVPNERVSIFVANLENFFNRLTYQPLEQEKIKVIKRNLLLFYQFALALQEIKSMSRLLQLCRLLEESYNSHKFFRPPPFRITKVCRHWNLSFHIIRVNGHILRNLVNAV